MKQATVALVALAIGGCATAPGDDDIPPERGASNYRCDAAPAQRLIGRAATADLAAEAQRVTGSGSVRWLQPGQVVAMEYRADRLNIELDAANRVMAIRCG